MDWRSRAACGTEEPELFFPIGSTEASLDQLAEAVAVCRRCPVLIQCRTWALETGEDAGVWGGMSPDERREIRRSTRYQHLLHGQPVPRPAEQAERCRLTEDQSLERHAAASTNTAGSVGLVTG